MKHLFVFALLSASLSAQAETCREKIARTMCILERTPKPTHCLPDTEALYYPQFQVVYDQLPKKLQGAICTLDKIQIDPEMKTSAWSDFRFRAALVAADLSLNHWASWKDQLNFGASNGSDFTVRADLPIVETNLPPDHRGLYFLVLHEIGHALQCHGKDITRWIEIDDLPVNNFPNKERLCSYDCTTPPLSGEEIPALYREWDKSYYLSLYGAGKGMGEDMADTFAYWMVNEQHPKAEYWISLRNGDRYEVMSKLRSERFREKREIIDRCYQVTDFKKARVMRFSVPAVE